MLDLSEIRRAAAAERAAAGLTADAPTNAAAVTKAIAARLDVSVKRFKPNRVRGPDVLGTLNAKARQMHVAKRLPASEAAMVEAHELGHYVLHRDLGHRFAESGSRAGASPHGTFAAIGYSERERLELEADAFAIELLCPASWLRDQVVRLGRRPAAISSELGLPQRDVLAHAVEAILNECGEREDRRGQRSRWADRGASGPLPQKPGNSVLDCGPDGDPVAVASLHVARLIRGGVAPGRILVLASSEGVLDATRIRTAAAAGSRSGTMWSGTPASLGFEIMAKNARLAGRTPRFKLLDETGARVRFEEIRRLLAPTLSRSEAFNVAFAAKVRLIDPATWLAEADADRRSARAPGDVSRARAAHDLGRTWAAYEARLAAEDAVDAADLVSTPVLLLRTQPDILAALADRFRHLVAVDVQDFDAGGLEIIRLLASSGVSTWSVGDPGRCVARHAGARPQAMTELARDLGVAGSHAKPGATPADARALGGEWDVRPMRIPPDVRPDPEQRPCRTVREEARLIAERVETLRQCGIPIGEQVVLAHAHHVLKAIAREFEDTGLTTTMLPDLRTEAAAEDLLAVATLAIDGDAGALARVAALPTYALSDDEIDQARELFNARSSSRQGRCVPSERLRRLAADFEGVDRASAAAAMRTWLFERSDHLRHVFMEADATSRDRTLAVLHHVIRIAEEHEAQGDADLAHLRKRIDRAGGLRQSTAFGRAAIPGAAEALRIMTIRASRGSLFRAVHVAGVRKGRMSLKMPRGGLTPPTRLAGRWEGHSDLAGIEEALLRVATSRATEQVHLSGADAYPWIDARAASPPPTRDVATQWTRTMHDVPFA